jgi:hypothetical protein
MKNPHPDNVIAMKMNIQYRKEANKELKDLKTILAFIPPL